MNKQKTILMAALVAATFFGVNAQVGINTTDPSPNSALHIAAPNSDKGVIFPQLTDADIEGIVPATEMPNPNDPANPIGVNEDGLLVYNIQTGCYNYYNKATDEWISLCGTPPPAVFEVDNCATGVKAVGVYIKDDVFGINNYLQVKVNVLKIGTYAIIASTANNNGNGYFFSASGTFPKTGTYTVNLAGVGTPANSGTDLINFVGNGLGQICDFPLVIEENTPDYIITAAKPMPSTQWSVGTAFDDSYYAEVELLVNRPGKWEISSSVVNGYQFGGSGMIQEGAGYNPNGTMPQTVKVNVPVVLPSMAAAYNTGVDAFMLSTSNAVTYSNCSMNVPLAQTQFTVECATADVSNLQLLEQWEELPSNAKIILTVTTPKAYTTALTADFAGLSFSSGEIKIAAGTSSITLTPTTAGQSPSQSGVFHVQFASTKGGMIACENSVSVSVFPAQAAFSYVSLVSATNNAEYLVDRRAGKLDTPCDLTVRVIASRAGEYYFSTTVNGVTWRSSGTVPAGTSIITMYPVQPSINRPTSTGAKQVSLRYNAGDAYMVTTNAIDVFFITRQINILSIGERDMDRMTPGTDTYYTANAILKNTDNFGRQGRVGLSSVNIIDGGDKPGFNTLRNLINANKIDIVFFAGGNPLESSSNAVDVGLVLNNFIAKGGVVIFAGQEVASAQNLLNTLYQTNSIKVTFHTNSAQFEIAPSGLSHKVLNGGLWGNSYTGQGTKLDFAGKYIGDDTGNGTRVVPSTLPSTAVPIATWNGMNMANCPTGAVLMFVDDSKNLFFSGDWAWAKGMGIGTASNAYPAQHSYGTPAVKPKFFDDGYGGVDNGPVVNSFVYTNVMAWAIETAAAKRQDGDI